MGLRWTGKSCPSRNLRRPILRPTMQFWQKDAAAIRIADEVWRTETRRTRIGTRRRSARAARSHSASRRPLLLSHEAPHLAARAASETCDAAADSALAPSQMLLAARQQRALGN